MTEAEPLEDGRKWVDKHPITAIRAYDLIHSLPTQPPDRQQRIVDIVVRLYSRP